MASRIRTIKSLGSPINWAIDCWEIRSPMSEKLNKRILNKLNLNLYPITLNAEMKNSQLQRMTPFLPEIQHQVN